ncbi:indolepyruvate ferredoxin oxidoreductase subunit alpha [Clostridia bacterium]|nr:indolepyruvate ferredoxin oxidoreductase subunit alpha [Clostridia bacterium]
MKTLMTGNEAIARGAYEAGVRVGVAYPGTPSTEILENVAKYDEIRSQWSPNEKVAMEVGIGASIAGARTLVAMKHVGVNVAADPLMTFTYMGVNGGLVLVTADDPGMHSSQNEQDNRIFARFAQIPLIEPSDSQEVIDFIKEAYEISEKFDTPVLFRETTRIAHSQSLVEQKERLDIPLKDYVKDAKKNVMLPAHGKLRHVVVEARREKLAEYAETTSMNRIEWGDKKVGIIASGAVYQYVKEVMPEASVLKLGFSYPLPKKMISSFVNQVETCYVIEELEPVVEDQLKAWGLSVIGKDLFPRVGEFSPELIAEKLNIPREKAALAGREGIPVRPPVLCPGCPHRGIYFIINKLKLRVTGDIGCYTLGAAPPLSAMDTCVCMGGSIPVSHGMELARGRDFVKDTVAVIGDSTFMHSGMTGLADVVYNGGTSTILILDNSTTAMTGHQDNPTTGKTLSQGDGSQIDVVKVAEAMGIKRVRVVDPYDLKATEQALKEETSAAETSVIVFRRPCVLLKGCAPSGNVVNVDQDVCRACGLCAKLGCPAIVFKGDKPTIDISLCNGCGVCVDVCPFGAISEVNDNE